MDIIVFALIAAVLCYRLFSILGKEEGPVAEKVSVKSTQTNNEPKVDRLDQILWRYHIPRFLKPVFAEILLKNPRFDVKDFFNGAAAAYEMIITAAYTNKLETVREYVTDNVSTLLNELAEDEQKLRVKVQEVLIVNAAFETPIAELTVQISATIITRQKTVQRTEDWLFTKNLEDTAPTWVLNQVILIQQN